MRRRVVSTVAMLGCLALSMVTSLSCGGSPSFDADRADSGKDAAKDGRVPNDAPLDSRDPSGPPYPIILAHGMGGFGTLKGLPITYFNGVRADLAKAGETTVFVPVETP